MMTHGRRPWTPSAHCAPSDEVTMRPSLCSVGDMVVVLFQKSQAQQGWDDLRLRGRVVAVGQHGAKVGPYTSAGLRMAIRSIYCHDDECVLEEVNGESLFEM